MRHHHPAPIERVGPAPRAFSLAGLGLVPRLGIAAVLVAFVWLLLTLVR
jgi:hypothetical protein